MTYWFAKDALWSDPLADKHAGNKARKDIDNILESLGWVPLEVAPSEGHTKNASLFSKLSEHIKAAKLWDLALERTSTGDVVLLQMPLVNHSIFFSRIMEKAIKRGVRFIAFIHDLDTMRVSAMREQTGLSRMRTKFEEVKPLVACASTIVHNEAMRDYLVKGFGFDEETVVCLGIFDYLCGDDFNEVRAHRDAPIAICGSLRSEKAGYVYQLPKTATFNLYGVGFEGTSTSNVTYKGSYTPEELVSVIDGSFGLVWDGPSAESCEGPYGVYLTVNNPHKASMYLAAGLPILIWKDAALSHLILDKDMGICISSLDEVAEAIVSLSNYRYDQMLSNVHRFSAGLRNGDHTKLAVKNALHVLGLEDLSEMEQHEKRR